MDTKPTNQRPCGSPLHCQRERSAAAEAEAEAGQQTTSGRGGEDLPRRGAAPGSRRFALPEAGQQTRSGGEGGDRRRGAGKPRWVLPEAEQQTTSGGEGGRGPAAAPGSLGLEW
jgi:hypothetical protein